MFYISTVTVPGNEKPNNKQCSSRVNINMVTFLGSLHTLSDLHETRVVQSKISIEVYRSLQGTVQMHIVTNKTYTQKTVHVRSVHSKQEGEGDFFLWQ